MARSDLPDRLGRFELRRVVGRGGMGVVYEAWDTERGAAVALKTLRHAGPGTIARLKREFRVLAGFAHPNLVPLYELLAVDDTWFLTMELVEGGTFLDYVRPGGQRSADTSTETVAARCPANPRGMASTALRGGPEIRLAELRDALIQLVQGVAALHAAGWLHRDLKPGNVLVRRDGRVMICDFGLVAEVPEIGTASPRVEGTVAYMAPEQSEGIALKASDWYAVGTMLYEAVSRRLPFTGSRDEVIALKHSVDPVPPSQLSHDVPSDLEALCMALLARDPNARPEAAEILERLGAGDARPVTSLGTRRDAPFVGRADALAVLSNALAATRDGTPVVATIRGPSGVGKSAIARRFAHDADLRGALVLSGRCFESESVPYKGVDSVIDALAERIDPALASGISIRGRGALARLFPVLGDALFVAGMPLIAVRDPHEARRRAFQALRELLHTLAVRQPLAIVVDDAQWGDPDSARLLAAVCGSPDPPPMLLVLCERDDSPPGLLASAAAGAVRELRAIDLGPLPVGDAALLARRMLERDGVQASSEVAERIARESGGNPFLVSELAEHAASARIGPAAAGLVAALRARVDQLEPGAHALLIASAVAARPLGAGVLAHAARLSDADERAAIAQLAAARLIRVSGPAERPVVETAHDRVRDAMIARLDGAELRAAHEHLAGALAALAPDDAEALGEHWLAAGNHVLARPAVARAAAAAAAALAFERAARLYRQAIELESDPAKGRALHAALGDVLAAAGRGLEAARAYLAACEPNDRGGALALRRNAADQLLRSGHIDEGLAILRDVLAEVGLRLPATPTRAAIALLLRRGALRVRGLRHRQRALGDTAPRELERIDTCWSVAVGLGIVDTIRGAYFQTRHLSLALRAGEPYRVCRALAIEAAYMATAGARSHARADAALARAGELAAQLDRPEATGLVLTMETLASYMQGHWRRALDAGERAETVLRDQCVGVAWERDSTNLFSCLALYQLGDLAELRQRVPTLVRDAVERGDLYGATNLRARLGFLEPLANDDPVAAADLVTDALRPWSQRGFHVQHYFEVIARSYIDLYSGEARRAHRRIVDAWSHVARAQLLHLQVIRVEMHYLRALAAAARAADEPTAARKLLEAAVRDGERIAAERCRWSNGHASIVAAVVASVRGEQVRAGDELDLATEQLAVCEMTLHATATRIARAQVLGDDPAPAAAALVAQGVVAPMRMAGMLAPVIVAPRAAPT